MANFEQLGIAPAQCELLKLGGITEPTPIQQNAIPPILEGHDVVGQAQTGTGKTLAFILPMMQKLDASKNKLQGLILAPTRELALQITTELKRWIPRTEPALRVVAVYGGQDVEAQLRKLGNGVHIAVATPGRLLDHLRRETISLGGVSMLVLDEADQMLHMGFLNDVEDILGRIPTRRQTMLFSATMPQQVRSLSTRFMRQPQDITVQAPKITVEAIKQIVVETTDRRKYDALVKMMESNPPYLAMIFCRTKRRAIALNEALQEAGYASDELHGDLSQAKREQVMRRFREARLQFLVATDIAARGLDVEGVTHVYNYDVPLDAESYIHRIGRTGRAGGDGLAVTFATVRDGYAIEQIEKGIGQSLARVSETGTPIKAAKPTGEQAASRGRGGNGARSSRTGNGGASGGGRRGGTRTGGPNTTAGRGGRTGGTRHSEERPANASRRGGSATGAGAAAQGFGEQRGRNASPRHASASGNTAPSRRGGGATGGGRSAGRGWEGRSSSSGPKRGGERSNRRGR